LFALLRLLRELKKNNLSLEDLKAPEFHYELLSLEKNKNIIDILKKYFENKEVKIEDLNGELDGLEFIGNQFRILVRESQTEPLYRIVLESYNNMDINEIKKLIIER
ncbi:MAG: hypothetical protein QXD25_02440, partial [Nanopusillaceae archaeon]